mgnify:CR=1 FL=1
MKKVLFFAALLVGSVSYGQRPTAESSPFSMEGVLNMTGQGISWQAPTIRARYFVNDNIAIRASIGLGDGMGTPQSESYTIADTSDAIGSADITRLAWNAQVGGEYHLKGTERMSPYFFLGVNFGAGSSNLSTSDALPDGSGGYNYAAGSSFSREGSRSMIGVDLGAGLDVYVIDNLYLGLELGLGWTSMTFDDIVTEVTTPIGSTVTEELGYSQSFLGTSAGTAAIRLGWRF